MSTRMPLDEDRGSGRTMRQMQAAPRGAHFVWCNSHTSYARAMAARLGRLDLHIHGADALRDGALRGLPRGAVVVDHALVVKGKYYSGMAALSATSAALDAVVA